MSPKNLRVIDSGIGRDRSLFEMEEDLATIRDLADAIFLIANGMEIDEGFRRPIESIAVAITDRVKLAERHRALAAGQAVQS